MTLLPLLSHHELHHHHTMHHHRTWHPHPYQPPPRLPPAPTAVQLALVAVRRAAQQAVRCGDQTWLAGWGLSRWVMCSSGQQGRRLNK